MCCRGSCYHLFDHNCNTFSNELANFLTGKGIPAEITNLPNEVKDTYVFSILLQFSFYLLQQMPFLIEKMEQFPVASTRVRSATNEEI